GFIAGIRRRRLPATRCRHREPSPLPQKAMAMQVGKTTAPLSPQVIGSAFVKQYYNVLHSSPEQVHKFYHDSSTLGRPDPNGAMTTVTTMHAIDEEILSTDFTSCLIKLDDVDAQTSFNGGVLILVTGSFNQQGIVNHRFTQSFFLAPQEGGGYFVLNDMLRYVPEMPSTEINDTLANHVSDNTQSVTFTAEPVNVKEIADLELPSAENVAVSDKVMSTNDNTPVVKNVVVETCAEVIIEGAENIPEAAPAPSASSKKDVTKQSYASVVKITKEGTPPTPVAKSKPKPKPKPKPMSKVAENSEKSVSLPAKPTHAADTSPNEKNVLVEHGYSVFLKNLPFNSTVEMVEEKFRKFGAIKPGGIQVRNRQADRFCFGFVEFESRESMITAIEASPISFGSKECYVEEKRTTTRVVNGVVHVENNGNAQGGWFRQDRGGYRGDNFRGREAGFMNSANYRDSDNTRNGFRNQNEYRGRGPQGNGYQNGSDYHQNGTGYHENGNGYHHNGNRYNQNRNGYNQNGNGYQQNGNGYYQNGNGYHQERLFHNGNGNGRSARFNGPRQTPVAA
ncbi:hypothetical protein ABZP36_001222, partial [Zizania latifolia]